MSTTLDRRKAKQNYAEFDEYISFQLQKTQTGIRSTDIFTAICGAAVFVISYLLVFVVLDHWVVTGGFGNAMRAVLLVGMLVGTLAWIGWKVVWPCFRRVNSLYAAKALEEASPDLKSTLLNYVDLRSSQREVAPAIIGSMEKRAAVTLSHAEVDDAIDRSTLLRLSYALLAAVVLFSVYSVASPKKVWPSIVRIFAPSSDTSVSTQTAFLSVDPGDSQVLAREFLTVTTDLSGEVPEEVTLFFTTADQQFVDEAVPMREVEAGLKRYQCILKGDRGEGLLQGLTYRIAAGDASTQTYHVTVVQPPSATVNEVRYSFPDYMELPPDRAVGSNIDTWEGTKIEITATANMVVDSAKLQFSDEAEFPARCEEIRMEVGGDGTSLSGLWQPIIRDDRTYPKFYRVQCRTKDGATDPTPAVHSIQIQVDQKPDVSTLQPGGDMEVAANAVVALLIHASDPDFRLSRVVLRMKNGARALTDRAIYKGDDVEQRVLHELKIADLNAKPGDVITWWVEAHDNRRVETSSRTLLDENRSSTPRLKFLIRAEVSEEEAKEQLERDKQRAEEKLDELDQRSGNDDQSVDDSGSDMPDREPDATKGEPSDANDQRPKNDEPESEETPPDEKSSDGEESKDEGKGGDDSDSNSDGDDGKQSGDETGKSEGDKTGAGEEGADSKGRDGESKPDGEKGESGPQKPVSNDGSQDDEILRELLKQTRDSKPDGSKDGGKKDAGEKNDGDANKSPKDRPEGEKSDSPDTEPGDKDSASDSPSSKGNDTKDENEVKKPKDGSLPDKPDGNSSDDGMPGEEGKKPPKDSEEPDSSSNSNKGNDGDDPSKDGKPQDDPSADKPSDASGMPDAEKPKSGDSPSDGDDPKTSPSSEPSDDPSDAGKPGEADKNEDDASKSEPGDASKASEPGDASKSSEPGDASKGGEPGKSEGSNSSDEDGDSGESSPSKKGSDGKSPAENGSKSGAGGESKDKSPGSGSSESSSKDGGKPGDGSASDKPGQSSTDKPGSGQGSDPKGKDDGKPGKASGEEAGSKPGKDSSESGGDQKSGDAKSGKQGSGDAPGKAGKPGEGNSDGGKPSKGSSGAGQSKKPGGNPGQSTGSKPSGSSDPGGEAVASPDDDANLDDAVQRPGSGANPSDPNLKDADKANLDDKLKASNMVLKRLKEELDRGDVDPELLKKLGWTEKDMKRFAERLERQLAQPKPDDPAAEARRRQFEEVLRNVDLESSGREQAGDFSNQKSTNNFSERRLPAPRSHRKAYEDYIKRLSQQRRGSAAPKSRK
jgi:collagen type III alpha